MAISDQLVERVRQAIGTPYVKASDADVARALGLSRATVWAYKNQRQRMSMETFADACELAGVSEQEVVVMLGALFAESPLSSPIEQKRRVFWERTLAAVSKAAAERIQARPGRRRKVVVALALVTVGAALGGAPGLSQAAVGPSGGPAIHYANWRRRPGWRPPWRPRRRFGSVIPATA